MTEGTAGTGGGNRGRSRKRAHDSPGEDTSDLHPEHVQSLIVDAQESLYRKRLQKAILAFIVIIVDLVAVGFLIAILVVTGQWREGLGPSVACVLVLTLSPIPLYFEHISVRNAQVRLRKLNLIERANRRDAEARASAAGEDGALLAEHKRYRDDVIEVIAGFRDEANWYRRWHNGFQGVIIVGSVTTAAITTASVSFEQVRWVAVGASAVVGLAAGFTGYFKYRERSYNLQQTADAIEREYESVALRVGRYRPFANESDAYAEFADVVEHLRDEQSKRQQQLDQPTEAKKGQSGAE